MSKYIVILLSLTLVTPAVTQHAVIDVNGETYVCNLIGWSIDGNDTTVAGRVEEPPPFTPPGDF
jgi:hypothetical protein